MPRMAATLSDRLRAAEHTVDRLSPAEAAAAAEAGAVIVDIRASATRERDGVIAGSVHLPLTVLPWRLEPGGAWRSPHVAEAARVVLVCDHGFASLLAAAGLVELGIDATDVVGGVAAWAEAGLPLAAWVDPALGPGELQGMGPPVPARVSLQAPR